MSNVPPGPPPPPGGGGYPPPGQPPGPPPGPPPGGYGPPPGQPPGPPPGQPGGYGPPPGQPPGGYGPPPGQPGGYGPGAYGATAGGLAEWPQRALGYLIDLGIAVGLVIIAVILSAILGAISDVLGLLVAIVLYLGVLGYAFYIAYLNGATGQSPGKRVLGLKVIRERDGQVIGGGMGIVRYLAHIVDSLICYVGWLFPLWDQKKQTIADKLVGTVVVTGQPKQPFGPAIFRP